MKASHLLIAATIGLLSQTGYSQSNGDNNNYESNSRLASSTVGGPAAKAVGSKYINENFMPGNYSDGSLILFRYNAFEDQIEFKNSEDVAQYLVGKKGGTVSTTDKKTTYEYNDYTTSKNESKTGFLNVVSSNPNVKIYVSDKIYLQAESKASSGYATSKPPTYKKATPEYYIKIKENPIVFMTTKKKDFAKLFPGKENEVNNYIKENKISLTDEQDLKKLAGFLNGL